MKEYLSMKRMHWYLIALLIAASTVQGGSLRGTVRDAQSSAPLVSVNVTVNVIIPDSIPYPTTTDADGKYQVTGIVPGNKIYEVVVRKGGYVWSIARIDSLGSLDLVYDFDLTPEPVVPPGVETSTVFGSITTPSHADESLTPVSNARIKFASISQQYDVQSDTSGQYSMNVPLGTYIIQVNADGYNKLTLSGVQVASSGASVNAVLQSASTGIDRERASWQPGRPILSEAYPNPFNPTTTIRFSMPRTAYAALRIFNAEGKEVARLMSGKINAGEHSMEWNASGLTSGVYCCRLEAGGLTETRKLVLLK
jgi:hypothetical protein